MTGTIGHKERVGDDGEFILELVYTLDGVPVTKEEFDLAFPDQDLTGGAPGGHSPACWPMKSWSAGVAHPDLIPDAIALDARLGVPTQYTPDGDAIFRDRNHRKQFIRAHKMRDRDGGYGD